MDNKIEELFSVICARITKGIQIHNNLTKAFGFLNLCGYETMQHYRFLEEVKMYNDLNSFYLNSYNKMIEELPLGEVNIIPKNWYNHIKDDVDTSTKRTAIRDLFQEWVNWEKETKSFFEIKYKELYEIGDICGAIKVGKYIQEVNIEYQIAHNMFLDLEAIGYDITLIIDKQVNMYKEYQKKIKKIYEGEE